MSSLTLRIGALIAVFSHRADQGRNDKILNLDLNLNLPFRLTKDQGRFLYLYLYLYLRFAAPAAAPPTPSATTNIPRFTSAAQASWFSLRTRPWSERHEALNLTPVLVPRRLFIQDVRLCAGT
jgi:hypothetical protein